MRISTAFAAFVAVLLGMIGGAAKQAEATFITFTESAILSGSLGTASFNNALLTITGTADTANVMPPPDEYTVLTTATLRIGVGPAVSFLDPITAIDNQGDQIAGFRDLTTSQFLYNQNSAFATYDLKSSIGPSSGTIFYATGRTFATSAGDLVITGGAPTATFSAVLSTSAVPEPSSFALCGIAGVIGLAVARARRRRHA